MSHGSKDRSNECSICMKRDLRTRTTRQSIKDSWIQCDCCKLWFHSSCGGFTSSQYTKISKDSLWLKCIICCTQHILASQSAEQAALLTTSIIERAKSRIQQPSANSSKGSNKKNGKLLPQVLCQSTPTQGTVILPNSVSSSEVKCENTYPETASDSICNISSSKPQQDNSTNQQSTSYSSGTNEHAVSRCTPSLYLNSGDNQNVSCIATKSDTLETLNIGTANIDLSLSERHNASVFYNSTVIDNVLVVDNIDNPDEFTSSKRILNEIHNFFPDLKVDYAYALAKGGIAIHTANKADRDFLRYNLPKESFGGGIKHPPKGNCNKVLFVKGVDTKVDLGEFTKYLISLGVAVTSIRRLIRRHSGRPTQVIKVTCEEQSASKLLHTKVLVNRKLCAVETQRQVHVIRCFKCQRLGHIAAYCKNNRVCEFCASGHCEGDKCTGEVKCANCGGAHPSSSPKCEVFVERYEMLAVQHTERFNLASTSAPHCRKVEH